MKTCLQKSLSSQHLVPLATESTTRLVKLQQAIAPAHHHLHQLPLPQKHPWNHLWQQSMKTCWQKPTRSQHLTSLTMKSMKTRAIPQKIKANLLEPALPMLIALKPFKCAQNWPMGTPPMCFFMEKKEQLASTWLLRL